MNARPIAGLLSVIWIACILFAAGYLVGFRMARRSLPSCLYVNRPNTALRGPFGCDYKEGVDVSAYGIEGGGFFVSLEKWKCP